MRRIADFTRTSRDFSLGPKGDVAQPCRLARTNTAHWFLHLGLENSSAIGARCAREMDWCRLMVAHSSG